MSTIKRLLYITLGSASLLWNTGCRSYVEVTPQGKRALVNTTDYQLLLQSENDMAPSFSFPVYAADDYGVSYDPFENSMLTAQANAYIWAETIVADADDPDWTRFYKQIYTCNTIIEGVRSSQGGTTQQKEVVRSQALVHRAYAYLMLVNGYARHYEKATAATAPGVPLLLKPDLFAPLNRASVQAVYDQIMADLKEAAPVLPTQAVVTLLPSSTAAYALMARASLYMGDYANAAAYADSALSRQSALLDLKVYAGSPSTMPTVYKDPEIMLVKNVGASTTYALNPDLVKLFEPGDLRYDLYTADGSSFQWSSFPGRGYWRTRLTLASGAYTGPGVGEMMLILAECDARTGKTAEAVTLLNKLREKRFTAADYVALDTNDAEEALRLVLTERRRELMASGLRWFDQKRLNLDPKYTVTVSRTYRGQTYTLAPNSNRYVFPIPAKNIQFNPELVQNPR
ncbi:RagB/SusD domain-containing protein [Chitinophaga sp. YR627]|uniref:RagB/SusD family nutrient uptake outer membrane protein n=1 Tax=Chitinophaga sp. YR627 TaxID=1881041 RepID=UPI0008DFE28A|nr:RagB/SusD family nutrient uptake outer membrane protein [Chitinophaga sp. YR627]SFM82800.1 RagB/SusD domain-containing protein [Chitinophaga sp. YR627]